MIDRDVNRRMDRNIQITFSKMKKTFIKKSKTNRKKSDFFNNDR